MTLGFFKVLYIKYINLIFLYIIMRGIDIIGNIAIAKFSRSEKKKDKLRQAGEILKKMKNVTTVLEKSKKFSGRLRVQKTSFLSGINTKEALYRENGCAFHLNIDTCYFSPRLAGERMEIARQAKASDSILVMFGGVAPFAITIAKIASPKKVVSVELSRTCNKYALENVRRNKLQDKIQLIQGDVKKKVPQLREKFTRIVMARPNLKETFLPTALKASKKGTIIHFYGFCKESDLESMKSQLLEEAKKARKPVKLLAVRRAGDIGVRAFRYRIDLKLEK